MTTFTSLVAKAKHEQHVVHKFKYRWQHTCFPCTAAPLVDFCYSWQKPAVTQYIHYTLLSLAQCLHGSRRRRTIVNYSFKTPFEIKIGKLCTFIIFVHYKFLIWTIWKNIQKGGGKLFKLKSGFFKERFIVKPKYILTNLAS